MYHLYPGRQTVLAGERWTESWNHYRVHHLTASGVTENCWQYHPIIVIHCLLQRIISLSWVAPFHRWTWGCCRINCANLVAFLAFGMLMVLFLSWIRMCSNFKTDWNLWSYFLGFFIPNSTAAMWTTRYYILPLLGGTRADAFRWNRQPAGDLFLLDDHDSADCRLCHFFQVSVPCDFKESTRRCYIKYAMIWIN